MLVRDMLSSNQNTSADARAALAKYEAKKENWLEFCMFPDLVEPVRMPSLFPIPTHIVRRQTVTTIVPAGGNIWGLWKPCTLNSASEATIDEGYRSAFHYNTVDNHANNLDDDANVDVKQAAFTNIFNPTFSNISGLSSGGARMIGAFIEIEYIGTVEEHAGLIEVGLHMHSANNALDLQKVHGFTQGEIIQAPFYRKFKPHDGVRCVWFPADEDAFNFHDFDIALTQTGQLDPDGPGVGINGRLQQVNLRTPVYPEWAINMSGLSANQAIRIHMCSYYETCPDEANRDIFMAKKSQAGVNISSLKTAITAAVQSEMVATPAKSSGGFVSFREKAQQYLDGLSSIYGLYQQAAPFLGTAMRMVGV